MDNKEFDVEQLEKVSAGCQITFPDPYYVQKEDKESGGSVGTW